MIENQTTELRDVRMDEPHMDEPKSTAELISKGNSGVDRPNGPVDGGMSSHPSRGGLCGRAGCIRARMV